ncbi:MAG: STAS domain-containing protein [Candidatus Krumholzibacteria bacterium]|nr:STAS domain-containing protein [Candidatus Krumholzibacteria bacterium]MDH4335681.1 STAS domain-containing protein [Candidatus Krumholzibacteria bacterium]MDH5270026.1 STAS domain-containing protein [Candidatus Krumholzibacteria bacterium]MDH5627345.1 STAS domain-containing protein [Candidatus Krumholzibacteria bacterium]
MLKLKRRDIDEVVVVEMSGNLMGGPGHDRDDFHAFIKASLEEDKRLFVIDLGKVAWANSLGVGMLIGALASVRSAEGEMVLARLADRMKSIFITTQLTRIFQTFDSTDEAIQYLKQSKAAGAQ